MKAAIYTRISLDATGEGLGVTRQLEDCRALVDSLGWTVVEVYTDNDISASSGKVRPDYRRMLKAIEAGEIDAIVAWAPDRIYRKLADLEKLITICETHNTTIRTVKAGEFDLSTALGKMIARILGSVAQGEGDVKSERWQRSVRQRREAGLPHQMGPRLYGYNREGDDIVEHEAEHLRWAAAQLIDGAALLRVTIELNERGSRTSMGNEWNRASVRRTLSNPRLAGRSHIRGDVIGVGQWPPIFDDDTFEQLQLRLAQRASGERMPRVALLTGIIFCGLPDCGAPLKSGRRAASQGRKRTYKCATLPGTNSGCGRILVNAEEVEAYVEGFVKERSADPSVRARLEALGAQTGDRTAEVLALEARVAELEAQLDEPGVPVATVLRAIDRANEKIESIRATSVTVTPVPLRDDPWPADLARRVRLTRQVVERVVIHPAKQGWVFDDDRVEIIPRTFGG